MAIPVAWAVALHCCSLPFHFLQGRTLPFMTLGDLTACLKQGHKTPEWDWL
jgi:hypothetical protein